MCISSGTALELYGSDLEWIVDDELVGLPCREISEQPDFGMKSQRGYHWPAPESHVK